MKKHSLLIILLLFVLSLPILLPLFHPGFFVSDDGEWMVIRFSAFHQAFRDGEIPVRFLGRLNHEYGYPVSTFLYPGPFYLAEPFRLIGFGFVDSIKILFGLSIISSGIFTYYWLRKFFDMSSSLIGSLVFLYTPYHLYDLYKRGSLGEMIALALVPFILWQIERQSIFWCALGVGLLILSHNTLAALFMIIIVSYCLLDLYVSKDKKKKLLFSLQSVCLGVGLAAFYWIPAILELPYTVFLKTSVSHWQEYFAPVQLIGYATFILIFFTSYLFLARKIVLKKHRLTLFFLGLSVVTVFLASSFSSFLWNVLPVDFIQFPFRVLSITLLCLAFLASCSFSVLHGRVKIVSSILLICLLFFSVFPFMKPNQYTMNDEGFYATNMDTTTIKNEYMPIWVKQKPLQKADDKIEIIKGEGAITEITDENNRIQFITTLKNRSLIQINTIYWPGWSLLVDNKNQEIAYNNERGLMQISIPAGVHRIDARFGETPLRLVADVFSIVSFVILVILAFRKQKKTISKAKK